MPFIEQAVSLSTQTVSLRRELASTYIGLRAYSKAIALIEESLTLFPADRGLYHYKWLASVLQSGLVGANAVLRSAKDAGLTDDATWSMEFDASWLSRNYDGALRLLAQSKRETFHIQAGDFPVELLHGMVHGLAGRQDLARDAYRGAIPKLRDLIQKPAATPWHHGWLAVALAGAGERDSALQQLQLVKDLTSLTPDPWSNPFLEQELLLHVYLIIGEKDSAIELLQELLESRHYGAMSRAWLQMDPRLDPLQNDPRFDALAGGRPRTASSR